MIALNFTCLFVLNDGSTGCYTPHRRKILHILYVSATVAYDSPPHRTYPQSLRFMSNRSEFKKNFDRYNSQTSLENEYLKLLSLCRRHITDAVSLP